MIKQGLENILHLYENPSHNDTAEKIVSDPMYDDVSKISIDGIVKETILNDRYYLYTTPKNTEIEYDMILYYHGSRDIAWTQVLEYTDLLKNTDKYR